MNLPKVAFVCVHNSCRSQMAEAIAKKYAADVFTAYSVGTKIKSAINEDAVDVIKRLYDVDIAKSQSTKLLKSIPPIDVIITMGCNVECPYLACKHCKDWGLDDSSGKGEDEFVKTARTIEQKVLELKQNINKLLGEKNDDKRSKPDD